MKTTTDFKSLTDAEIIDIILKTKNTQLFGELYDRHINVVYNKCLGFSKSEAEAQDLTQDVFLQAYTKLHMFVENVSFRQWLYVMTYNFCVNYVKRDKHKKMEQKSVELNDANEFLIEVDDHSLFQLKTDRLEKALTLIEPDDKMILLLKYQDDVSIKELAVALEAGESAIKMRLKRAKSRLVEAYNTL